MTNVGTDRRQQRLALAILFGTIALTALLFAQGTTRLVAESLLEVEPHTSAPPSSGTAALGAGVSAAPGHTRDKTRILRRNIFDSATGPLDGTRVADVVPSDVPPPPPVPVDPNAPPPPCDGSMRLVAAVVSPRSPDQSLAAITNAAGKVLLYRPGMQVDGREVVEVRSEEVRLRPSAGALCALNMFSSGIRTATAPAAVAVAPAAEAVVTAEPGGAEGAIAAADLDRGIQRVSDTEFGISRSLVDRVLENRGALMRTARVVPHEVGGRVVGVKLYGIRRNSLLGRVGIENGDVLRSINGYDMSDPNSALEAYARLRSADHLTLAVERRGTPMSLNYNIR